MIILYYPQNTPPRMGRLPLSTLALGAVLEGSHDYVFVDGNVDRNAYESITKLLRSSQEKIILAVSVMPGTQMLNAIAHCKKWKSRFPKMTIIWGGYFPSMHAEAALNSDYVDYVVRGQGERSLPKFLENILADNPPSEVENTSYKIDGNFIHNPELPIYDPNERPPLPFHRINMDDYALPTFIGSRTFCHESSVGCPHKCNFCGVVDVFHSRWKAETPERTLQTVQLLKSRYGLNGIEFHDSDFFVSESRVAALAKGLIGFNLQWWGEGRVDTLLNYAPETWELMKRSGLRMIFFGAESGLDETLKLMDKGGVTREKTKSIASLCAKYDIQSEFSFVMGANPTRTEEDIDATIDLMYELEEINPRSQMHPFIYTPVPFGTIYDNAVEGGLNYPKNLDEWATHEWAQYTLRRNPHTPWLTPRLYKKIINFRAVHQSYYPKTNDRTLAPWKISFLRNLSSWRYKSRIFTGAYELRLFLRLLTKSQPSFEGF